MAEPQTRAPDAGNNLKRYVMIGVPIIVIGVVLAIIFGPKLALDYRINQLYSDSAENRRVAREALIQEPQEDWIDDQMRSALEDSDRSFEVRHILVDVLAERNRLGTHIEPAYIEGDLDTRGVILAWLSNQPFFHRTYAGDPRFEVPQTVRAWLTREGDLTRMHAVTLAQQLELADTVPLIRPMLATDVPPESDIQRTKRRQHLVTGAIAALEAFGDCDSIPAIRSLAQESANGVVRWRAAQTVDRMTQTDNADCPGVVSEEDVTALMIGFLDDDAAVPRIGALTNFEMHPERARGHEARLLEILDGDVATDPRRGPERRHALHVLIELGDPAFLDRLPQYFFDDNVNIRSSMAQRAPAIEVPRLDSCLIGLVDREPESALVFRYALESLNRKALRWQGLSKTLHRHRQDDRARFLDDLEKIFDGVEIDGTTRAGIVKAYFEWLAKDLGLEGDEITRAWEARQAFWEAADQGDADAAQAALDAAGVRIPGLFTYEEAWLERAGA